MDTHSIRTTRRPGARVVLAVIVLAIAASVLTIQARSIWSTHTAPVTRPPVGQVDPQQSTGGGHGTDKVVKAPGRPSLRQVLAKRSG